MESSHNNLTAVLLPPVPHFYERSEVYRTDRLTARRPFLAKYVYLHLHITFGLGVLHTYRLTAAASAASTATARPTTTYEMDFF